MISPWEAQEGRDPALRRRLYEGELLRAKPNAASLALSEQVLELLASELGSSDVRMVAKELSPQVFFESIGRVRKTLFLEPHYHRCIRALLAELGFDVERTAFDPLRLRCIMHNGHENPRAAAVYLPHRDTWYAHSQSILVWWVPLHDLEEAETFVVYPEYLARPVENDSQSFVYKSWVKDGWELKIGWQDEDAGLRAQYPGALWLPPLEESVGFACERGENLLMSGAHFHRTLPQATGKTRYSLDFRILNLDDHRAGLGAPNVDNRSQGDALVDYIKPESFSG